MPTLQDKLCEFLKLPHKNFLHKSLVGYLGLEEWTQEDGNTITLYHDGSIRILKKEYPADMDIQKFLYEMNKKFDVLYDKALDEAVGDLCSIKAKLAEIANRIPSNGFYQFQPTVTRKLIEAQINSLSGVYETLNAIKNQNSTYKV
jgi:hypothetical protein